MKTSDLEQVISAYVDGEIPQGKRAAVERLVQNNEQAAAYYNEFIRIRQGLRALPPATLPSDFASGVITAIQQRQMPETRSNTTGTRRVSRVRRLVIPGTISLCVVAVAAALFMRSISPSVSTSPGRTTAMVPASTQPDHQVAPVVEPAATALPVATEVKKPETTKREGVWMTAPVPLAVQGTAVPKVTKPTLDALLWVHCTPIASQDKKFADEFVKYCMSKSLNFTASGRYVYEFKMTRSDFADFVQWLRQNPLTGGDVQVSEALNGWSTGRTSYSMPLDQTGAVSSEAQVFPMADELSIRLQINTER